MAQLRRYVGVASTVIGLVCYALSSSFNSLCGDWNLFKICAYIVSSSIICLAILFPEAWQHLSIFKYKAHSAFLVLISTTAYSFYLDRKSKTKPDAYGLISSAAFAATSFCMSKQIGCGFLDLMYFFCGLLVMQLMQIKPLLFFVGISFGYILVILRYSLDDSPNGSQSQGYVRRHVGVALTVIGLSCYTLSSPINLALIEMDWVMTRMCIVSSSIICLSVLFSRECLHDRREYLPCRIIFLLLVVLPTITTVYSLYLDRKSEMQPDAYSLISSTAFAAMSLCMSNQIACGFPDFMHFFLAFLVVQFTLINFLLYFVGIGFGCVLTFLFFHLNYSPNRSQSQRGVQRYVGVASTVIGLVCYALCSSFNHLYGEWNSFKICAYIASSSIICLAILFPKALPDLRIFHHTAPFAFLVLITSTLYTFLLDTESERTELNPYVTISSAAFTVAVGMSHHIIFEFVDLMYFFCGLLAVQLMQIKPLLVFVGIGFGCFLVFLRFYLGDPPNGSQSQPSSPQSSAPDARQQEEKAVFKTKQLSLQSSHLQHSIQLHYDTDLALAEPHYEPELALRKE